MGRRAAGQVLGTLTDTTTHHTLLQNAEQIRLRDPLTDLPNKIATLEWLERQLRGRSHSANLTILSLDIDGFQEINDSFGHATGDRLLRTFATVLVSQLATEAWVGRLGSDEFVVIYHRGIGSLGEAIHLARELQFKLHAFDTLSPELPLRPTVSMGVSCFPEHSHAALPLLQCANTALMEAKRQGRGQLRAYSTTLSRQIRERLVLDVALHKAISREQLRILVQPQMDRSGLLCGGEVLLRWRDHQGKEISPGFFIPLAEQSALIFPISNWVLEATLEQISRGGWPKLTVPRLGINISTRLLESSDRRLPDQLHRALANHRLSPEALELEITETALLRNPIAAAETVRQLANEGFQIAIDDFGTGYSSMDLLRTLPVHKLKIDSSFIRNIGHSPEDHSIVASTITLAHGLACSASPRRGNGNPARHPAEPGLRPVPGYFYGRPGSVEVFGQLLLEPQGSPSKRQADPNPQPLSIPLQARATSFDELVALRGLIDSSLDAYVLMQTLFGPAGEIIDFTLLEANATACSYMRQQRDGLVGQTLCTLFPGVVSSGLLERLSACMQSRTPLELDDFAYPNHEVYGDTRVYDLRAYPSNNLLTLTWRDVTLRSRRYRDLAETADLLELLTHNVMGPWCCSMSNNRSPGSPPACSHVEAAVAGAPLWRALCHRRRRPRTGGPQPLAAPARGGRQPAVAPGQPPWRLVLGRCELPSPQWAWPAPTGSTIPPAPGGQRLRALPAPGRRNRTQRATAAPTRPSTRPRQPEAIRSPWPELRRQPGRITRSITCTTPLVQVRSAVTTVAFLSSKGSARRTGIGAPSRLGHSVQATRASRRWAPAITWYLRMRASWGGLSTRVCTVPGGRAAKASSTGASTVNGPGPSRAARKPAASTAASRVEKQPAAAAVSRIVGMVGSAISGSPGSARRRCRPRAAESGPSGPQRSGGWPVGARGWDHRADRTAPPAGPGSPPRSRSPSSAGS